MNMKRIVIICVNFNSYNCLQQYLHSIKLSLEDVEYVVVDIYIADNSSHKQLLDLSQFGLNIRLIALNNLGYLGGAFYVLNNLIDINNYDYIIISNVDLLLSKDFFTSLQSHVFDKNIAWIAPSILSRYENRDRNPNIIARYSKFKLRLLRCMYRYPIIHKIYVLTFYKRKKMRKNYSYMNIYAGHGSFMVFTKSFMKYYYPMSYPVFLFGEEIFFAELIRNLKMKVVYAPFLKVISDDHVSVSKMPTSFYYKCNKDALSYLLETFY